MCCLKSRTAITDTSISFVPTDHFMTETGLQSRQLYIPRLQLGTH